MKTITITLTEGEAGAVGYAIKRAMRDADSIDLKTRLESAYRILDEAPAEGVEEALSFLQDLQNNSDLSHHNRVRAAKLFLGLRGNPPAKTPYGGCP